MEKVAKFGPDASQFRVMRRSEALERERTFQCKQDVDFAPILDPRLAPDKPFGFEPVDQTDSTVVLDQKLLGQLIDGNRIPSWKSLHRKQRLVLLRCEANTACRGFTERKKAP